MILLSCSCAVRSYSEIEKDLALRIAKVMAVPYPKDPQSYLLMRLLQGCVSNLV